MNLPFGMEFPASTLVLGVLTGLIYGLLAAGMVIIYRTNRVINFAQGEIGALGAAFLIVAVRQWHIPYYVVLPFALAVGALVAAGAEVAVIRRLRNAPRLMSLVATVGIAQLLVAIAIPIAASARSGGGAQNFPSPPGLPTWSVGSLIVRPAYTGMLFLSPIVVLGLTIFLRRSRFGLALRGASANPEAARMAGIFASRMSTLAWAISGAFSTFAAILIAPTLPGGLATGASYGPSLLLRGLAAAVVGRMINIPVALAGGVGLGIVEGFFLRNFRSGALTDVALFVVIIVALLLQAREGAREEEKGSVWAHVQPWRRMPETVAKLWVVKNFGTVTGLVLLVGLAMVPTFWGNITAITVTGLLGFAMVALSIVVITGLGGQLALGQFAFAAVGATASYYIAIRSGGNLPVSLLYGGVAAAIATIVIGLPALRIKGLFLAVTTLSFAVAMSSWFLQQNWALSDGVDPGTARAFGIELFIGARYYYFMVVVFAVLFVIVKNIRRTGFGRLLLAVRDNEDAARAFAIHARRIKIQGFLLAGFIAGVGGAAYGHSFSEIDPSNFPVQHGIDTVVMSVVGGVGTLFGPLLGLVLVKGVPSFFSLGSILLITQRFGLLLLIMYFPAGLVQWVAPVRERLIRWLANRSGISLDEAEPTEVVSPRLEVARQNGHRKLLPEEESELLRADVIQKSYGGVLAVDEVSIAVNEGETVGLIGPNGAGKTTLFEVLAGFTRADRGRVMFDGKDVTNWSPEKRGENGLIRSFQDVSLFPTMTVLDTVQLALERRLPTRFFSSALGLGATDRRREQIARDVVGGMGLWSFRNKQIQELSTGTRRIAELASLIALRPKVLLLDEPSSGIAQRETEALGQLLDDLKREHNMTLVVIEHDIPLIMGLANRIVAMDAGRVVSQGSPEAVKNDPVVIEAYLGGRIEAIERSGTGGAKVRSGAGEKRS